MKYFRHAPLAFWSAVVLVLAAIAVSALSVKPLSVSDVKPFRVGAPSTSDLRGPALSLLERVSGSYSSATAAGFAEWSAATVQTAKDGAASFLLSGGDANSRLGQAWNVAVAAAVELQNTDPSDTPVLIERTARLNGAAQSLVALADSPEVSLVTKARSVTAANTSSSSEDSTTIAPPAPKEVQP